MKLSSLCIAYLKLIERTSRIELRGVEILNAAGGAVVGFWHEDSFIMNLALKKIQECGHNATAVITADPRGDVIEEIIRACQGNVIRLCYGPGAQQALRLIAKDVSESGLTLATALDGPLGPLHTIKRFLFFMANLSGSGLVGVKVRYARALRLWKRWDKYVIPLPFNRITVTLVDFGQVDETVLRDYKTHRSRMAAALLRSKREMKKEQRAVLRAACPRSGYGGRR